MSSYEIEYNQDILDSNSLNFQIVIEAVVESFDVEISKLKNNENMLLNVVESITGFYYAKDLHTFFILANLDKTVKDIYLSAILRDFILNLTDRVSFKMALSDISNDSLINAIVESVCRNKVNPRISNNSLINVELNESLYVSPEALTALLQDNFWLMVLFILIIFFQKTQVYESLLEVK